jgi:hypothetical protein
LLGADVAKSIGFAQRSAKYKIARGVQFANWERKTRLAALGDR